MPILTESKNPPSVNLNSSILESQGTWWIAKLKPRQEKAFAFDLLEQGIGYYLPMYTKISKRSDGKNRKSSLVLFPSYIPFIGEDPYKLLKGNRIATILPIQCQQRFKRQLYQVYLANESGVTVIPLESVQHKIGEMVKIVNGPMSGITGRIVRFGSGTSVVIEVEGMGSVLVSVESSSVESLGQGVE